MSTCAGGDGRLAVVMKPNPNANIQCEEAPIYPAPAGAVREWLLSCDDILVDMSVTTTVKTFGPHEHPSVAVGLPR